jgi:type III secretion system low calcium response chaperone LcrH/SycD
MNTEAAAAGQNDDDDAELTDVVAQIMNGETDIAAVAGLTDQDLEAVYAVGHGLYAAGKYQDALDFFRVLCICRQTESRFWFGFGATSQVLGDHANAVRAYSMAALFDVENPQIPLRAAECFIKLGDSGTARQALEAVGIVADGKAAHAAYAERARLMLQHLDEEAER